MEERCVEGVRRCRGCSRSTGGTRKTRCSNASVIDQLAFDHYPPGPGEKGIAAHRYSLIEADSWNGRRNRGEGRREYAGGINGEPACAEVDLWSYPSGGKGGNRKIRVEGIIVHHGVLHSAICDVSGLAGPFMIKADVAVIGNKRHHQRGDHRKNEENHDRGDQGESPVIADHSHPRS